MLDFTNFDLEQLFGLGEETNPLLMLVWILPIIIFVFYGQRIQLIIASNEIKNNIKKLEQYKSETRTELIKYVNDYLKPVSDPTVKIDRFLDYFTIMPVDMDPNGIVPKIRHVIRSREEYTRNHVKSLCKDCDEFEITKVQTLVEVATSLQLIHKIINHLYLTAKKQHNYPLILPLQMMLPFVMEEAEAMKDSFPAFKLGQPVGDSIGPMVIGKLMLNTKKQNISFQTVCSESEFEGRKLILLKAEGPSLTVGRLGDAVEEISQKNKLSCMIMVDASLKMEGEESATVARGFGAAIGGVGTERFQIEEIATKHRIPVFSIVIKESVKEAITLMTKEIAYKAEDIRKQIFEMIKENTKSGDTVLLIGVGNTSGVSQ